MNLTDNKLTNSRLDKHKQKKKRNFLANLRSITCNTVIGCDMAIDSWRKWDGEIIKKSEKNIYPLCQNKIVLNT